MFTVEVRDREDEDSWGDYRAPGAQQKVYTPDSPLPVKVYDERQYRCIKGKEPRFAVHCKEKQEGIARRDSRGE
jgi:hypothetical protein